ncbi:Zinc carboxypeptidase [Planctomycetes bacterium Poly30]|uniref:Zinc carboxypeptidase n=1 Tax=Saltatorellus ferox TaxID=2528018 RepID=A0A518EU34_9BACT|nr:Zinc carboxypeptidase [Planctomycetes bacterium Poly30]
MSLLPLLLSIVFALGHPSALQSGGPITQEQHVSYWSESFRGEDSAKYANANFPLTVAESSRFTRSSTLAEVETFLEALEALPAAGRISTRSFGETTEGRDLTAVTVRWAALDEAAEPVDASPSARARVLVNANIHGGEIEGKVAVQMLLREFALGYHAALLDRLEITFVPVFNADGNDRIARTNRVTQNGPDEGVGERANAMGLDLNRDFIKLETPEVRALTGLVRELQPHAFMDLHTTNGSPHGYELTYSPSLSPNVRPDLASYMADRFFPAVRSTLESRDGIHVYDYGNFSYARRQPGSRGERGDPIAWSTYDSRPRFGTNLMGLRGTVSILSEAYSYLPYEQRVVTTYAFVLECLETLARDAEFIQTFSEPTGDEATSGGRLGVDAELASIGSVPIRVSRNDEVVIDLDPEKDGIQEGVRMVAAGSDAVREVAMDVQTRFEAGRQVEYTGAFLVLDPAEDLLEILAIHLGDAALERIGEDGETLAVKVFVIDEAERSERVFQGHREARVRGRWEDRDVVAPAGSLRVRSSRLAAHLLHPESDDSLTTWNYFDRQIFGEEPQGSPEEAQGDAPAEGPHKAHVEVTHPVAMIR